MRLPLTLLLLGLLASPAALAAKGQIYKWVDKDGVVHYSGEPPSDKAQPTELPPLQTYKPSAQKAPLSVLDSSSTASKGNLNAAVSEVRITSPLPNEVLRSTGEDGSINVSVAAAVLPAAPAGASYAFYLDGQLQNSKASSSPSYTLKNVERGSHSVTVAVLDAAGRELKRSAPVSFSSRPPTDINGPARLPGNTLPAPLPNTGKPRIR